MPESDVRFCHTCGALVYSKSGRVLRATGPTADLEHFCDSGEPESLSVYLTSVLDKLTDITESEWAGYVLGRLKSGLSTVEEHPIPDRPKALRMQLGLVLDLDKRIHALELMIRSEQENLERELKREEDLTEPPE